MKQRTKNRICPKCNFHIKSSYDKHFNSCDGNGPRRRKIKVKHDVWNKNLKYKDIFTEEKCLDISFKIRNKIKIAYNEGRLTGKSSTNELEIERRKKISETMKKNNKSGGIRKGSGRGKKGYYKGIWCDSSWELAWVIYNLEHNINFERNNEKFKYVFNNEEHYYTPDFKCNNEFIEIKGYLRNNDTYKWEQFPYKLSVLKKNEMNHILKYVIDKYGKDFIKLYLK